MIQSGVNTQFFMELVISFSMKILHVSLSFAPVLSLFAGMPIWSFYKPSAEVGMRFPQPLLMLGKLTIVLNFRQESGSHVISNLGHLPHGFIEVKL